MENSGAVKYLYNIFSVMFDPNFNDLATKKLVQHNEWSLVDDR